MYHYQYLKEDNECSLIHSLMLLKDGEKLVERLKYSKQFLKGNFIPAKDMKQHKQNQKGTCNKSPGTPNGEK